LTDGRQVTIRPIRASDEEALVRMHAELSERSMYLRFFAVNRTAATEFARRVVRDHGMMTRSMVVDHDGQIIALGTYQMLTAATEAEVAFAVADRWQGMGLGTLLLEHLASHARLHGVERFRAEVLVGNSKMIRVFKDAGLAVRTSADHDIIHVDVPLNVDEWFLDTVAERERRADIASLQALLRPRAIAVVGASERPHSVGNALIRHLLDSGYRGPVYPVNLRGGEIEGLATYRSVTDLPEAPDLAMIAVPAVQVPDVAEECGRRGVRAVVAVSAGVHLDGPGSPGWRLRRAARQYGMRLVGPNCIGIANTDPEVRLDATFADNLVTPGEVGIVTQSGGVGIALLQLLRHAGLGTSTFVSTGDKYDVSSNDLLMWWSRDLRTRAAIMYVESFGNPRKFARIARHLSRSKPLITVRAAGSPEAQRAAHSHTAATGTGAVTRDALFRQAGVVATDSLREAIEALAVLAHQPLPEGNRVAVVTNAGGAGVLAADACRRAGLVLPVLSGEACRSIGQLLPESATTDNPVDTTAAVTEATFGDVVEAVARTGEIDALVSVVAPTAVTAFTGIDERLSRIAVPVVAVRLGQYASVSSQRPGDDATRRSVPVYADPEDAVRSLARACEYAAWRRRAPGVVPRIDGIDRDGARRVVAAAIDHLPADGWLDPAAVAQLAACYGLPVVESVQVDTEEAASRAYAEIGGAVAVKAAVAGLVHRTDEHAVRTAVRSEHAVRAAYREMSDRWGNRMAGVLIQPMVEPGLELLVGVTQDDTFGALVQLGAGGFASDLMADRSARLLPLTDVDAREMIGSLRITPLLMGFRGAEGFDVAAVEETVHRVARLAEDLPQVADLDMNPLIVHPSGCAAVDLKIRLTPREATDPYLRRLR
jgi:acyl-CoA synthetase (NDP forming)/GNAT superfamily N-acetyltransferase